MGWPAVPKPPMSTVSPSQTLASASSGVATNLLIDPAL
jgi:hypothetical protein